MGNMFKKATEDINFQHCIKLAQQAKNLKVKKFIFASSCSMYGASGDNLKKETDKLNPLTDYAISKVKAEQALKKMSDKLMDDIQETFNTSGETKEIPTIDLKLTEVKIKGKSKIRESYYENLNEEERAEKINEIIDKGYSNLSKLDKEVLELLKNIGKKG